MLGENAMAQVSEESLFWRYNPESNSVAMIVNHLAGNMLSRFRDSLIEMMTMLTDQIKNL